VLLLSGGCNLRPIVPFLPGTPAENLRNNPVLLDKGCTTCHTVGTFGGTVGPVLNQVGNRRSTQWLRTWLEDPSAVKPGTRMPNFELDQAEIEALAADLSKMRRKVDSAQILAGSATPQEAGRRLFEAHDCYACHRIGSRGGFNAPDLTWVGWWQSMEWEKGWLRDPATHRPGTFMPNFKLPPEEIEALTAFLGTLQGQEHEADQRWKGRAYRKKPVARGELIFEKVGCRGCHGEHGKAGGFRNPNAAPDETVPSLTRVSVNHEADELVRWMAKPRRPAKLNRAGPEPPLVCPGWPPALSASEREDVAAYVISLGPKKSKWSFQ